MKFKVGQQVIIKKRGQAPPLPWEVNDDMIGMVGTVDRVDKELGYWVVDIGDIDAYDWFDEDALESAKQEYIWVYDGNRRVYNRDENGKAIGSPIYRESWNKYKVISETTRSWVLEYNKKVPKKPEKWQKHAFAFSEQELEDLIWVDEYAYKISEAVRGADVGTLKKIAELMDGEWT